jgi:hypothetical protein
MHQETLLSVKRIALEARDFREVFNTSTTFVNEELARHYGIAGVTGSQFVEVELPLSTGRRGLLGHAGLLSLHSHASTSSPTLRGKFVREVMLCQKVPAPPPGVVASLPDTSEATTMREKLRIHALEPACGSCHSFMDPIGLGLENFDAIGAYRSQENSLPIDASGELDGTAFSGPAGLADALAAHPKAPGCFARTVFRYAWGRLEASADEPFIQALTEAFEQNSFRVQDLLMSAATLPEFYQVPPLD